MTARQLPLPFGSGHSYTAEDFIAAPSNEAARAWLARPEGWPFGRLVLCGAAASGKTHLLHLWAAREQAVFWSGPQLRAARPAPGSSGPIALDDADLADEIALFHLINAMAEARQPLLLAGRAPPSRWAVRLPDLASRLRASTTAMLGPAEDPLLAAILSRLLADRQLAVAPAVQDWLLTRLQRHPAALAEAAARLDRASLAHGRGISRVLAASVLAEMTADLPEDEVFVTIAPTAPVLL
ncbi:MAG: chromosomal replication initiator DnaA [Acetobacteraceae bacterium]|nr:chromosomal replication initiator DnaA [Acetobacteraceae bacterium]